MQIITPQVGLIFWLLVPSAAFILMILALIAIMRREFAQPIDRLLWVLVTLFVPILGALLYYGIGHRRP